MRSLGYMPNEVELEVIIQRLDMDGIKALTYNLLLDTQAQMFTSQPIYKIVIQ